MRLRHDGDDGYSRSGSDGFGSEFGKESLSFGVGESGYHFDELGGTGETVFAARRGFEGVEIDVVAFPREVYHGAYDLRYGSHACFFFA